MEVWRQQREHIVEQHGTGVSKENWLDHRNKAGMVKDVSNAYRELDDRRGREIFGPACSEYGRGIAANVRFTNNQRAKNLRRALLRHIETNTHSTALA